jgi:hypothetical protein
MSNAQSTDFRDRYGLLRPMLAWAILCRAAAGQSDPDPWDALVARGNQVQACAASGQERIQEPLAEAARLYRLAIESVDQALDRSSEERQRLGAFRANTVKSLSEVESRLAVWTKGYTEAQALQQKNQQQQATQALLSAKPLPCSLAAQELSRAIEKSCKELERRYQDGMRTMENARSALDLKSAIQLCQTAITLLTEAQRHDVDDRRPTDAVAICKEVVQTLSSVSKNEILILTDPGGARVAIRGEQESTVCGATPCKLRFDAAFFDKTGGPFVDSKRLLHPIVAEISKDGFRTTTIDITEGRPRVWKGSIPGQNIEQEYYVISLPKFTVHLMKL